MKLSDIMGAANLAVYAEVALAIFFVVYLGIVFHVRRGREEWRRASYLPLDGERPDSSSEEQA